MVGAERAGYGAAWVDVNRGSAVRTQADTAKIGEIDAQTIRANAARAAYNYRVQNVNFENEATMKAMAGANAFEAGKLGAFASLVSGASSVGAKWAQFKQIS